MRTIPELLVPAGSPDSLKAAIENGADAVYMGAKEFSARGHADNFDKDGLLEAIDLAHQRDVSAYITVNTLVKENELPEAAAFLELLCCHGADAVIIQDLGILGILRKSLPELPIHASTQMTVHNTSGVELLETLGVKRAVLARELSLGDIQTIRARTSLELETFIHGALCISYSGRCLMSSFLGGRSGNRGYCAQPCRKKYRMGTEEGYLLSPRDLNLSTRVHDLMQAGVNAFKIEGRMKKPEYVALVTRTYRDILDRMSEDPDAQVTQDELQRLEIMFNRGFTPGYINGDPGRSLMSRDHPGNRGTLLGHVIESNPDSITVELEMPLHLGDGIAVNRTGTAVNAIRRDGRLVTEAPAGAVISISFQGRPHPGAAVYKTYDTELVASARRSFGAINKKIHVSLNVEAKMGHRLVMRITDGRGNTAEASSQDTIQPARQQPVPKTTLIKQVGRLGDTVFDADDIQLHMDDDIFIPLGVMNSVRRDAVQQLEMIRLQHYRRDCRQVVIKDVPPNARYGIPGLSIRVMGPDAIYAAVSGGADRIYADIDGLIRYKDRTNAAVAQAHEARASVYIRLPDIIKDAEWHLIDRALEDLEGFDGIMVTGPDQAFRCTETIHVPVVADYPVNALNHETLDLLASLGISGVTISPELTLEEIADITSGVGTEGLVQGAVQLMISEHCLFRGINGCSYPRHAIQEGITRPCDNECSIRDEKGFDFPIRFDPMCRTHIYNSRELCLIDHLPEIMNTGLAFVRIEGSRYSPALVREITRLYRQAIDRYLEQPADFPGHTFLARVKKLFSRGLTTGHYFRGVQ